MIPEYSISIADKSEKEEVQFFIENYWKKNHALVLSSQLFDFQHKNPLTGNYNFIIAKAPNRKDDKIIALMGYIPTYQYDKELVRNGDFWGAIWKKREDVIDDEFKSTGFDVYQRIYEEPNFHSYAAIGVSKIALKIYRFWGCKVGYLNHYYILNNQKRKFAIAGNVDSVNFSRNSVDSECTSWKISEIEEKDLKTLKLEAYYRPFKSIDYIINRYTKHPVYKYKYLGVFNSHNLVTLLVVRIVRVNGSSCIRIIDVLGKLQGSLYESFQNVLHKTDAEYIDFLNYGIDESVIYEMGFRKLDSEGNLIIPNYFEPFEQRNVRIDIAWKADYENYVAFKGDSDQDRPNIL